jgi:hypothetical protein
LAGPSAGPNGGQIYIDGFTGGQLPPKSSIREIRINQNPFSAEYDKLGYGRIEMFTKPGTDKFHGQVSVQGSSAFNAQSVRQQRVALLFDDLQRQHRRSDQQEHRSSLIFSGATSTRFRSLTR